MSIEDLKYKEGFGALSKRRRGSPPRPGMDRDRPGYVRTIVAAAAVADGANIYAAQREEEEHVRVEMHRRFPSASPRSTQATVQYHILAGNRGSSKSESL